MKLKAVLNSLKQARGAAAFDSARFGPGKVTVTGTLCGSDDTADADLDTFIKEHTRIYRESWIIPYIDAVMAAVERDLEKQKKRRRT